MGQSFRLFGVDALPVWRCVLLFLPSPHHNHISSYIIIYHHISSYIIIYHHISSYIIIYHHISSPSSPSSPSSLHHFITSSMPAKLTVTSYQPFPEIGRVRASHLSHLPPRTKVQSRQFKSQPHLLPVAPKTCQCKRKIQKCHGYRKPSSKSPF